LALISEKGKILLELELEIGPKNIRFSNGLRNGIKEFIKEFYIPELVY
jgi:hypothetical protein